MYGFAFDINSTQLTASQIERVSEIFKKCGFSWGGDWISYQEKWHYEVKTKTKSELLALYNAGKTDGNGYVIV